MALSDSRRRRRRSAMLGRPNPRTMNHPAKSPTRIQRKVRSSITPLPRSTARRSGDVTHLQSKRCAGRNGVAAAASVGWRKGGYRMGNGARHMLVATGGTNGTKPAVILANQCGGYLSQQQRRARRIETTATASLGGRALPTWVSSRQHSVSVTQQILALANLLPAPARRSRGWEKYGPRGEAEVSGRKRRASEMQRCGYSGHGTIPACRGEPASQPDKPVAARASARRRFGLPLQLFKGLALHFPDVN